VEFCQSISLLAQLLLVKSTLGVAFAKSWKQFTEVEAVILLRDYYGLLTENLN